MVCATCGAPVAAGLNFCAKCGAAVAAAPVQGQEAPVYAPAPVPVAGHYGLPYMPVLRTRVQRNLQTMATLWFVYAAYRVVAGLAGMFFLHAFAGRGFGAPGWPFGRDFNEGWGQHHGWIGALLPVVMVFTVFSVALAVFVGFSLLNRKPWGRTLAIIAAVLALLKFPMGTALGIYTLWVMAPGESGMEWEAIADRS